MAKGRDGQFYVGGLVQKKEKRQGEDDVAVEQQQLKLEMDMGTE